MAKKKLSLKLTAGKLKQVRDAVQTISDYLAKPGIAETVALWPTLPETVQQEVLALAPTFAAVLALGAQLPEDRR